MRQFTREQKRTMNSDGVLKSLAPLTNTMRAFGLYFNADHVTRSTLAHQFCASVWRCCEMFSANALAQYSCILLL